MGSLSGDPFESPAAPPSWSPTGAWPGWPTQPADWLARPSQLARLARPASWPGLASLARPSYFPFTEPSAEVDVYWGLETEVDNRITKGTGWLEILGCGMVDPAVLEASGIDSRVYSGFAFGMGVERITMLKYQIGDLRAFFESDMRFLEQFQGER